MIGFVLLGGTKLCHHSKLLMWLSLSAVPWLVWKQIVVVWISFAESLSSFGLMKFQRNNATVNSSIVNHVAGFTWSNVLYYYAKEL